MGEGQVGEVRRSERFLSGIVGISASDGQPGGWWGPGEEARSGGGREQGWLQGAMRGQQGCARFGEKEKSSFIGVGGTREKVPGLTGWGSGQPPRCLPSTHFEAWAAGRAAGKLPQEASARTSAWGCTANHMCSVTLTCAHCPPRGPSTHSSPLARWQPGLLPRAHMQR